MARSPHTPPDDAGGRGDTPQVFAMRLRAWRLEQGYSQRRVALLADLTEQTVFNWEQGRSLPSYDALRKLAKASGISADWWLGLTDRRR